MSDSGNKRLLISFAHPDDESFGLAGVIAKYVQEGVDVYLICATNGDVGTVDDHYLSQYESIADLRLDELSCAANVLGIKQVFTFGYRDSGMPGTPDNDHPRSLVAAPDDEVTERIVEVIRQVKPQVVITFDPFGGYGHPDHIKMYECTTEAFHAAADPEQYVSQLKGVGGVHQADRLYYHTFNRNWLKPIVALMPFFGQDPEKFGRNNDINLRETVNQQFPIHVRMRTPSQKQTIEQARDCHASQLSINDERDDSKRSILDLINIVRVALSRSVYTFMRAYPEVNGHYNLENDLFEGIDIL